MKNLMKIFSCLTFALALAVCASVPADAESVSVPADVGKRVLDLGGTSVSETMLGGTVRFQVGYFNDANSLGFILYGKGSKGETADFSRQGLELRWNWGSYISPSSGESAYRYSFIIQPDNTGMYYDFSTSKDGTASPRAYFKCHEF